MLFIREYYLKKNTPQNQTKTPPNKWKTKTPPPAETLHSPKGIVKILSFTSLFKYIVSRVLNILHLWKVILS